MCDLRFIQADMYQDGILPDHSAHDPSIAVLGLVFLLQKYFLLLRTKVELQLKGSTFTLESRLPLD